MSDVFIKISHNLVTIEVPIDVKPSWLKARLKLPSEPLSVAKANGKEVPFPLCEYSSLFRNGEEVLLVLEEVHKPALQYVFAPPTENNANGVFFDVITTAPVTVHEINPRFYTATLGEMQVYVWIRKGQSHVGKVTSSDGWEFIKKQNVHVVANKQFLSISVDVKLPIGTSGIYLHCPQDELYLCNSNSGGFNHPILSITAQGYQIHSPIPFFVSGPHSAGYTFTGSVAFSIDN